MFLEVPFEIEDLHDDITYMRATPTYGITDLPVPPLAIFLAAAGS